jgi:GAF domain-containing protein
MLDWLRGILTSPVFEDEDKTRSARLLNLILWTLLVLAIMAGVVTIATSLSQPGQLLSGVLLSGLFALPTVAGQFLMRSGRVRLASLLLVGLLYLGFTYVVAAYGGVTAPIASVYVLLITIASLLLGRRMAIVSIALVILTGIGLVYAESVAGWIEQQTFSSTFAWITHSLVIIFVSVLFYLANDAIRRALDQAHRYSEELGEQQDRLAEIVEERTRDLQRRNRYLGMIASIARDMSLTTDISELVSRATLLIGERFDFYHVGVYLIDTSGDWAALQASSSQAGRMMVSRGHRVRVGPGSVVGSVAGGTGARTVSDVEQDDLFVYNPDLPETRSEMTLPLRVRGEVVGVLDLQSRDMRAFREEDVILFQVLADQVALALSNAQSFRQMQESLEAERRAYGRVTGESWKSLVRAQSRLAFLRDRRGVMPAGDVWRPEMAEAVSKGRIAVRDDDRTVLAVPIMARDQVIGVIDARKPDEAGEWTESEVSLLEALRDQLGEAVENARLYQDVQNRETRERVVGELATRMRQTLDVESVLRTAVQQVRHALDLSEVVVRLRPVSDRGDERAE